MPKYELRLYKRSGSPKNLHTLINQIPFEADDDAHAIAKAPSIQVPFWEDSDLAMLFDENGAHLWLLRP